jgi:hypothetical protein
VRRKLFTLLSFVSLLLFAAVCVLWVRSYIVGCGGVWRRFTWTETFSDVPAGVIPANHYKIATVYIGRGRLLLQFHENTQDGASGLPHWEWLATAPDEPVLAPSWQRTTGFGVETETGNGVPPSYSAAFPLWFPCMLTAVTPALWLRSVVKRRQRQRRGHCPSCGYDLRATADRCPECGRPAGNGTVLESTRLCSLRR